MKTLREHLKDFPTSDWDGCGDHAFFPWELLEEGTANDRRMKALVASTTDLQLIIADKGLIITLKEQS